MNYNTFYKKKHFHNILSAIYKKDMSISLLAITVRKIWVFTFTLFWQIFYESKVFNNEITKELIDEIFQ